MTEQEIDAPVTVAVMGSCITRDNFNSRFNPGYRQWYRTVLMQNQSSLVSLMSPATPISEAEIGEGTDYDRWNVRTDFSKAFLADLAAAPPDILILDWFGDIHFGLLRLGPDRFVTNNRWKLWPTPYYRDLDGETKGDTLRIERDTDAYLALWQDALERFAAHVRAVAPDTQVIVNRGRNAALLAIDAGTVSLQANRNLARLDLPKLDALWRRLDDIAVETTGWASIDLTDRDWPTSDVHPWGAYYVHYAPDFYSETLAALHAHHLEHVTPAPPYAASMEAFIADVHAARSRPLRRWEDEPGRATEIRIMDAPATTGPAAARATEGRDRPRKGKSGATPAPRPLHRRVLRRIRRLFGG